jgi:hypothetical protein
MLSGMYNTFVQVEMNHREPAPENLEELGQKHGVLVMLPAWRDRFTLQVGLLLIKMGQELTLASAKHMNLSKDMA